MEGEQQNQLPSMGEVQVPPVRGTITKDHQSTSYLLAHLNVMSVLDASFRRTGVCSSMQPHGESASCHVIVAFTSERESFVLPQLTSQGGWSQHTKNNTNRVILSMMRSLRDVQVSTVSPSNLIAKAP